MKTEDKFEQADYLSFKLDKELFALSVNHVLEVQESQRVTKIPNSPNYINGVINFRGEILPVVETRSKFNMDQRPADDSFVIIVLELNSHGKKIILGATVDSVQNVLSIKTSQIKQVPEMGANYDSDFIKGMLEDEEKFIMLLDINRVFSLDELNLLEKTGASSQEF